MEYIYSLFGGVFLTNIFFAVCKIKIKNNFYEKLQYFTIIPVLLYFIYIIFFVFQDLTIDYQQKLSLGIFGKVVFFVFIILQLLLVLYLQILMFKTSILMQENEALKNKIKKSLIIVNYSTVQGMVLHIVIWMLKAGGLF